VVSETPIPQAPSPVGPLPGGESSPVFSGAIEARAEAQAERDETVLAIMHAHRQAQLRDAMRVLATRQIQLGIVPLTDEERRALVLLLADALKDIER
jgi:hypothetical protein